MEKLEDFKILEMEKRAARSNELFFIISPPRSIVDYVTLLKKHVKSAIGHSFDDELSKAHISLFKYQNEHPEGILYQIDNKVSEFNPFHIYVKNLNYFTNGANRTIYLEIVYKNPICELVENLTDQPAGYIPHIPIASNLDVNDFITAWKSFQNLSYSDYFRCDHITVLKKSPNKWSHYIDIPLVA